MGRDRRGAGPSSGRESRCALLPALLGQAWAPARGFPGAGAAAVSWLPATRPVASFIPALTLEPRRPTLSLPALPSPLISLLLAFFSVPGRQAPARGSKEVSFRSPCPSVPTPWPLRGLALLSLAFFSVPRAPAAARSDAFLGWVPGEEMGAVISRIVGAHSARLNSRGAGTRFGPILRAHSAPDRHISRDLLHVRWRTLPR